MRRDFLGGFFGGRPRARAGAAAARSRRRARFGRAGAERALSEVGGGGRHGEVGGEAAAFGVGGGGGGFAGAVLEVDG